MSDRQMADHERPTHELEAVRQTPDNLLIYDLENPEAWIQGHYVDLPDRETDG